LFVDAALALELKKPPRREKGAEVDDDDGGGGGGGGGCRADKVMLLLPSAFQSLNPHPEWEAADFLSESSPLMAMGGGNPFFPTEDDSPT